MSQWFPGLDAAFGGIGDTIDNTTDSAGDAAGNLLGGLFGPLGNWFLKLALLGLGAWAFVKVVG